MTIQGHCNFLRQRFAQPGRSQLAVVVANDVRVFRDVAGSLSFLGPDHPLIGLSSRGLAQLACEIYAGNGITAYLHDPDSDSATLSTPELSFVIPGWDLAGVVGGVNISASHNPPDDNGVKLYDEFGSQPVAPEDQQLLDIMSAVSDIRSLPFAEALASGSGEGHPHRTARTITWKATGSCTGTSSPPESSFPVVYTPLCGVGLGTVGDVLTAIGFPMLTPTHERPDGSFAVIPFRSPNPEVPQSTEPARAFADRHGSGHRAVQRPRRRSRWLRDQAARPRAAAGITSTATRSPPSLTYALMLDPEGPRRKGLVIETLVTTKLLGRIVAARGESDLIDDLLVGFKYVADVLKRLGRDGRYRQVQRRPEELVLAAEESHGVIALPHILDKDATPACMYLAGLYQRLATQGRTLLDYYISILEQLGGFDTVNRSIMMAGAAGMRAQGPDHGLAAGRHRRPSWLATP